MLCCFFFKQKTAYEVRISDWSSDVCSSDLVSFGGGMMGGMMGSGMGGGMGGMMDGGTMDGGMMGEMMDRMMQGMRHDGVWTVNGVSASGHVMEPMLTLSRGRPYLLALHNDTAWHHPIHLHGHSFRVLSRNGPEIGRAHV